MPQKVVRYGLISTAHIGLSRHVPAARESANSQVLAVSSRDEARARAAARGHGIPKWYGSYDTLLDDNDLDAVINCLPNSMHCEWTVKAAEAGKHVLCEKPLAVTMDEARRMIGAARANGVLLVEAFTPRWSPHLRLARELVDQGAIGRVTGLRSALTFPVDDSNDIRLSPELAGGSLMDAGCYVVYACRFVLGAEPLRASAFESDGAGYGVDTTFTGMLEFPGGTVANVVSSLEQTPCADFVAMGSEGRIEIPDFFDDSGPIVIKAGDDERVEATPAPSRFRVQLDEFSQCVLTGKAPEYPAEDGLRNMAALVALRSAAQQGAVVDVEKAA